MHPPTAPGKLIIVSGPSGSGKTTVLARLLADPPVPLRLAVSATTRPPRPGEQDGVNYYFLSPQEFQRRRERGEFLECFEVFGRGHWYGTLHSEVAPSLEAGQWVILEIDVNGMLAVTEQFPDAITIFLRPSSGEDLERRLRVRGTESEAAIQRRLNEARRELALMDRYQHHVINDDLDAAVAGIKRVLAEYRDSYHPNA